MNLVIVESPAKGNTIKKILGADYNVLASFGHVRDLPTKEIGVDLKDNFKPKYVIPPKSRKVIKALKEEIAKADEIYIATDYDREGEAIAWHVLKACGFKDKKIHRITFHEITKPAVLEAMKNARDIDMNLVDAQQARRILDRIVGYKLSPFLWQKVARGLSAGRVQSVAVRIIVEREAEIKKFIPEEFWQIWANLCKDKKEFQAALTEKNGEKIEKLSVKNQKKADEITKDLENSPYTIREIKETQKKRYPSPPFTTSTLQQESGRRFGFSAKRTMQIAQKLYEEGLITYMRTDSVSVSQVAVKQARIVIEKKFGKNYLPEKEKFYKTKTLRAQEAHEAIRPTNLEKSEILTDESNVKLYNLIYKRMLASQMAEAISDETKVIIDAPGKNDEYVFVTQGMRLNFDGFLKLFSVKEETEEQNLPKLTKGDLLTFKSLEKEQKFTEPPARYTEGSLIKELEKKGIGRPSTYAPTLSTIIDRGYIEKIEGKLIPKEVGIIVSGVLVEHFPEIVDYEFTSKMEEELDKIAEGDLSWQKTLEKFYTPFSKNLTIKNKEVEKQNFVEKTDQKCPDCKKNLNIKIGRYGKFLACSGYPDCKYTSPIIKGSIDEAHQKEVAEKISKEKCAKCGKDMSLKEGKFGTFLACSGYPECKYTKSIEIAAKVKCPECGSDLLQRRTRKGRMFWGCKGYPKCKTAFWNEPQKETCPECKSLLTLNSKTKEIKCSKCEYRKE